MLGKANTDELNKWLSFFFLETRNQKGEKYPPKTLYQLMCGLLRYARLQIDPNYPNFLDVKNTSFRPLQNTMDNVFKQLRKEGIGAEKKRAEVVTKEDEERLWSTQTIGIHDPQALFRAVFYYNGKNFCLRGGLEHRNLRLSQLVRVHDPDGYIYTEYASKNRTGGYLQLDVPNKTVPIYSTPSAGNRCHVFLLDTYISKLPTEATKLDIFYLRPLPVAPKNPIKPWFYSSPIGKNVLSSMLKTMCVDAGIEGHKTNHSLRATGATEMFKAGVPEKIIQQRTGHMSLKALRVYERTTIEQQKAVCNVLQSKESTPSYSAALECQSATVTQSKSDASSSASNIYNNCTFNITVARPDKQPTTTFPNDFFDGLRLEDLLN